MLESGDADAFGYGFEDVADVAIQVGRAEEVEMGSDEFMIGFVSGGEVSQEELPDAIGVGIIGERPLAAVEFPPERFDVLFEGAEFGEQIGEELFIGGEGGVERGRGQGAEIQRGIGQCREGWAVEKHAQFGPPVEGQFAGAAPKSQGEETGKRSGQGPKPRDPRQEIIAVATGA